MQDKKKEKQKNPMYRILFLDEENAVLYKYVHMQPVMWEICKECAIMAAFSQLKTVISTYSLTNSL